MEKPNVNCSQLWVITNLWFSFAASFSIQNGRTRKSKSFSTRFPPFPASLHKCCRVNSWLSQLNPVDCIQWFKDSGKWFTFIISTRSFSRSAHFNLISHPTGKQPKPLRLTRLQVQVFVRELILFSGEHNQKPSVFLYQKKIISEESFKQLRIGEVISRKK